MMRRAYSSRHAFVSLACAALLAACAGDDVTAPVDPQFSVGDSAGPDTVAPELRAFAIGPQRVDVDAGPREVQFTVAAADEGAGAHVVFVNIESPSGRQREFCSAFAQDPGTPAPTRWQCTVSIPQFAEPGDWSISSISLHDRVGNERHYTTAELRAAHFPTTVRVVSTTPDATAPSIAALTLDPASVDVTAGPATVHVRATLTDDLSGTVFAQFNLVSPSGNQSVRCDLMSLAAGDGTNGEWRCDVTVPQFAEAGEWRLFRFWVRDAAGNLREYTTETLEAAGFPTRLTVASGAADDAPPTLLGITLSPDTVDLSGGAQSVEVSVVAADAGTGVEHVIVFLTAPDASGGSGCLAGSPVEGDRSQGTFRCSIQIDAEAVAGEWKVPDVTIEDAVGNALFLTTADLEAAGFDVSVTVVR